MSESTFFFLLRNLKLVDNCKLRIKYKNTELMWQEPKINQRNPWLSIKKMLITEASARDCLIIWIVFYAVSTIFRPYNGKKIIGTETEELKDSHLILTYLWMAFSSKGYLMNFPLAPSDKWKTNKTLNPRQKQISYAIWSICVFTVNFTVNLYMGSSIHISTCNVCTWMQYMWWE